MAKRPQAKKEKQKKKPQSKRKSQKYPNLDPSVNLRTRWEEVNDIASYAHKLSPEEKEWANKFVGEYVHAALDYDNLENNLHNTKELKKSCTDRNNARNRDIFTRARASGSLVGLLDMHGEEDSGVNED